MVSLHMRESPIIGENSKQRIMKTVKRNGLVRTVL